MSFSSLTPFSVQEGQTVQSGQMNVFLGFMLQDTSEGQMLANICLCDCEACKSHCHGKKRKKKNFILVVKKQINE